MIFCEGFPDMLYKMFYLKTEKLPTLMNASMCIGDAMVTFLPTHSQI